MNNKLFTYGTLRVDEPNSVILNYHSDFHETCKTVNKYIMITQNSKSFPFIFPVDFWPEKDNYAVNIIGDVYNIDNIGIARCDKLEGHPIWYKRTTILVKNPKNDIYEVQAYLLTKEAFNELNKNKVVFLGGDWKFIY
jgi:gamma-glutamylcyclotransferase (GGCT)/AIG2-like uncharacterized protein YtfP